MSLSLSCRLFRGPAIAAAVACLLVSPSRAQSYIVTLLPGTSTGATTSATSINYDDQVAGQSGGAAVTWAHGVLTNIGTPNDAINSNAVGVNPSGLSAVNAAFPDLSVQTYTAKASVGFSSIGSLGGTLTQAWSMDDLGQIAGGGLLAGGSEDAFLWSGGSLTDLGAIAGQPNSIAMAVNDVGGIVGYSFGTYTTPATGWLLYGGNTSLLGTLPGGTSARPYAVNQSNIAVGEADTSSGNWHAFLYERGSLEDLGTLPGDTDSVAYGINVSGTVVGESRYVSGSYAARAAFVFSRGRMTDLNSMIPAGSGWQLLTATAINFDGTIIGSGYLNGQPASFLLRPIHLGPPFRLGPR